MLLMLILVPLQLPAGGATPRESMPEAVQPFIPAAPDTRFMMLARATLYRGAGLGVVCRSSRRSR